MSNFKMELRVAVLLGLVTTGFAFPKPNWNQQNGNNEFQNGQGFSKIPHFNSGSWQKPWQNGFGASQYNNPGFNYGKPGFSFQNYPNFGEPVGFGAGYTDYHNFGGPGQDSFPNGVGNHGHIHNNNNKPGSFAQNHGAGFFSQNNLGSQGYFGTGFRYNALNQNGFQNFGPRTIEDNNLNRNGINNGLADATSSNIIETIGQEDSNGDQPQLLEPVDPSFGKPGSFKHGSHNFAAFGHQQGNNNGFVQYGPLNGMPEGSWKENFGHFSHGPSSLGFGQGNPGFPSENFGHFGHGSSSPGGFGQGYGFNGPFGQPYFGPNNLYFPGYTGFGLPNNGFLGHAGQPGFWGHNSNFKHPEADSTEKVEEDLNNGEQMHNENDVEIKINEN